MNFEGDVYRIVPKKCYVNIKYRVRVVNGPVIKGGTEPEMMDFVTGYSQVIPGLERRLIGHASGEKLTFTVPAEEAFGPRYEQLQFEKDKADFHFPPGMEPYPGMELPIILSKDEGPDTVMVKEVKEDSIVVDANHPLAGRELHYDLEIVEARPAGDADLCSEWDENDHSCDSEGACTALHQVVLGGGDGEPSRN